MDTDEGSPVLAGTKRTSVFPPYSSTDKRIKQVLMPAEQMTNLIEEMKVESMQYKVRMFSAEDDESKWKSLFTTILMDLTDLLAKTDAKDRFIVSPSKTRAKEIVNGFSEDEFSLWKNGVLNGVGKDDWTDLMEHPKLRAPAVTNLNNRLWQTKRYYFDEHLNGAYNTPFVGDASEEFVDFLHDFGRDKKKRRQLYAKAISVVQSSGTGKSRMLTEAARKVFTLPICLRDPHDAGYPPGDEKVHEYLLKLPKKNDLSFTAHVGIACFLAASYASMLEELKKKNEDLQNEFALLTWWHSAMEQDRKGFRNAFFSEVIKAAESMKNEYLDKIKEKSPLLNSDAGEDNKTKIEQFAEKTYCDIVKPAVTNLLEFISTLDRKIPELCITYVDEADQLGNLIWVLFRLASFQSESAAMWYVCMATKSSVSYFHPHPKNISSCRLSDEVKKLLAPYFALGFDQLMIYTLKSPKRVTMGELRSLSHLCKFGRPLWNALFPQAEDDIINFALIKLINGTTFDPHNQDHVLAVLSERLSIDLVLAASEVFQLADRSVAQHMRLLTGISSKPMTLYTYSPSEPILALAATQALFEPYTWPTSLNTFTAKLCDSGAVEKGLVGELAARTLLLITRDFAAPTMKVDEGPNMLEPVHLFTFFDKLFGGTEWSRKCFKDAFPDTYLNFTHWIITKDALPEQTDPQLLANLWARQVALQCAFNQEAIDLLIPTYAGSIAHNDVFDPAMLSAVVVQVKYKTKADTAAEDDMRPLGIDRDLDAPLPYVTFLMELGNESHHQVSKTKVKSTMWESGRTTYSELVKKWTTAVDTLDNHKVLKSPKAEIDAARKVVDICQKNMHSFKRYSIAARGSSADTYGILKEAEVEEAFAALLKVTAPSPTELDGKIPQMRPYERFRKSSDHTAWTFQYYK